ncbi:MAG: MOSC domain-containing protein [Candidatus Nanopelagicales bacterium]
MRVSLLSVTPVKSLAVHHPDHVHLVAGGVAGDRAFFLVGEDGGLVTCTRDGGLLRYRSEFDPSTGVLDVRGPDGVVRAAEVELGRPVATDFFGLRTVDGHEVEGWGPLLSGIVGRPVRLVRGSSGGFDVRGVTLLGGRTVEELGARNESGPVDSRRFRMNIEITGGEALDEDTWEGRRLGVGSAVVTVGGPVKRCAATTRNPGTGDVDLKTLQMIGRFRGRQETEQFGAGFYLGVYADVLVPGRVNVGDPVSLVD